jgi:hypothetical protein
MLYIQSVFRSTTSTGPVLWGDTYAFLAQCVYHKVIMYFIETKAKSRLPFFGHLPLNTYLSVVCIAAVAMELGGLKKKFISAGLFEVKKCSFCIFAVLANNSYSK